MKQREFTTTSSGSTTALDLMLSVVPGLLVSALYASVLGYRRDYLGHYAAGYGGTLGAVIAVLAVLP